MVTALVVAFAAGFVARGIGLPALVGFLLAGFGLEALGFEADATLHTIADVGILLLLFGIGLKLQIRTITRPVVWGTALVFGAIGTVVVTGTLLALGGIGLALASDLSIVASLTIAFALSFSSTVFTVQALERRNESGSFPGKIAVSILVVQDLIAVGYIVVVAGDVPSVWAVPVLIGLVAARRPALWVLERTGHGEVLVLFGFAAAVGIGAGLFGLVGLKPDLGALAAGLLLSGHPRASELTDRLLGFKDLLLVGFFLSIGLAGIPSFEAWVVGFVVLLQLPFRSATLFVLLTRFGLRARTSLHTSISLSTYSEFGLIVAAAATRASTLDQEWVSTIGVALAASIVVTSIANTGRYRLFAVLGTRLQRFERSIPIPEDAVIDFGEARIVVFGMGRVGTGAYERFEERLGPCVVGIDRSDETVQRQTALGRRVVRGDALDRDFWERASFHPDVELVVAAMNSHEANLECVSRVKEFLPHSRMASIAMHPDQVANLEAAGVDVARNLYEEAGQGLADDSIQRTIEP